MLKFSIVLDTESVALKDDHLFQLTKILQAITRALGDHGRWINQYTIKPLPEYLSTDEVEVQVGLVGQIVLPGEEKLFVRSMILLCNKTLSQEGTGKIWELIRDTLDRREHELKNAGTALKFVLEAIPVTCPVQ